MSRNEENIVNSIYKKVEEKGLMNEFYTQLNKMSTQPKHKWKSTSDKWEYALYRINGGKSKDK